MVNTYNLDFATGLANYPIVKIIDIVEYFTDKKSCTYSFLDDGDGEIFIEKPYITFSSEMPTLENYPTGLILNPVNTGNIVYGIEDCYILPIKKDLSLSLQRYGIDFYSLLFKPLLDEVLNGFIISRDVLLLDISNAQNTADALTAISTAIPLPSIVTQATNIINNIVEMNIKLNNLNTLIDNLNEIVTNYTTFAGGA